MRFNEFRQINKKPLNEAARIQHAEDFIFWEGSKGAIRVLQSLENLEKGGHEDVTVKWDGSPAVIFGRDENGEFVFTDKSGFGAKGYDGKAKSANDLEKMLMNRPGANNPNPDKAADYRVFVGNMKSVFDEYEKATPQGYVGFFKGDMLYFNTPGIQDGRFVFRPNIVEYSVDTNSDIGRKIAQSKTGIVIHREVDMNGAESPLKNGNIFEGEEVLVFPPVTANSAPEIDNTSINELKVVINKNAKAIDDMLNVNTLTQMKLKKLPDVFYAYMNSKVDTGINNLGQDFLQWVANRPQISDAAKKKINEYIAQHQQGFKSLWEVVTKVMQVKDNIIRQLDQQDIPVKQSINGEEGGEGYVLAHPQGDIKLVPREFFTKANRAVER